MKGTLGFGGTLGRTWHRALGLPPESARVRHLTIPGLGRVAFCRDPGNALKAGQFMFASHLQARHRNRHGLILGDHDLGSGLVTIGGVNLLVSDAVAGGIATFANFKYHDSGTGATAATDGDTGLQTPIVATAPARSVGTLANAQTATTGNHAAILSNTATIVYNTVGPTYPLAITEWGLFSALTSGTMWDHKIFAAINVSSGDSITWDYSLTASSNS